MLASFFNHNPDLYRTLNELHKTDNLIIVPRYERSHSDGIRTRAFGIH
jgi:hypothetical protein